MKWFEERKIRRNQGLGSTNWRVVVVTAAVIAATALASAMFVLVPGRTASGTAVATLATAAAVPQRDYVILGWNNLGMHCYNRDCADFLILPPYNTLQAQVVKVADPPQIVTSGVTLEYTFPHNTFSAGKPPRPDKTNFWQYAQQIFGLSSPLAVNVGLKGKGLSGVMDPGTDSFVAEGIPLTEYRDVDVHGSDPTKWSSYPYQLSRLTARDATTKAALAQNIIVAPVSSELSCYMCHMDDGDATVKSGITPTGKVETNILATHDALSATQYPPGHTALLMTRRPVLCAECHSSNALNAPGVTGVSSLSNAIHNRHKDLPDITPDTAGCFTCHPGPNTQCLRCAMSQNFAFTCVTCHGTLANVALNTSPWLNEPRCDNTACHGPGYALDQPLYRMSKGHGGIYCCGCHDSPHAQAVSRESNDAVKFVVLQGRAGALRDCTVCHRTQPTSAFVHRYVPPTP